MLQSVLAWLTSPPQDDPRQELGPLTRHLRQVAELPMAPLQRLGLLDIFESRVAAASTALKPTLIEASLPLPQSMRKIGDGLLEIHGLLALAMLRSLHETAPEQLANRGREMSKLCERILRNLAEQQQVSLFISTTAPVGLWTHVRDVIFSLRTISDADTATAEEVLKGMLALAAVQPESFTARQLFFLTDYLSNYATAVEINPQSMPPLGNWHWLEEGRDLPPIAIARKSPPNGGTPFYFSCATLGRIANQHRTQLLNGESPESLRLPSGNPEEICQLLVRAQTHWSTPPRRHSHRRPTHYRVEICARFGKLWELLRGCTTGQAIADPASITDWMVLNESPSGFALMHVAGPVTDLVSGETLGLRLTPERPWSIGLIRWVRSDNPEHFELGLEMISPSAAPVQIVRAGTEGTRSVPALLLPSMSGPDHRETLMAQRGMANTGPFTLIRESQGRLQFTQCRMQHPTLQTARVELFEFQRDFSAE